MEKEKLILDAIMLIKAAAEDLQECSVRLQGLCKALAGDQEQKAKEEPRPSLEEVRGILADKSRAGHTAEIREIIKRYGADKLSAVDPKNYSAILKEAEGLSDE